MIHQQLLLQVTLKGCWTHTATITMVCGAGWVWRGSSWSGEGSPGGLAPHCCVPFFMGGFEIKAPIFKGIDWEQYNNISVLEYIKLQD